MRVGGNIPGAARIWGDKNCQNDIPDSAEK
jgi:hypothetical protein